MFQNRIYFLWLIYIDSSNIIFVGNNSKVCIVDETANFSSFNKYSRKEFYGLRAIFHKLLNTYFFSVQDS